ncbi:unnamed protein product [Medioppia subpectinata]|uniref:Serine protease K12H4.7 n=1 Tax=Medioppia subpectinata TaxID=1979941 RepID=A0A7R9KCN4_9ACAR|nr:unnamed protein product [Medioppia subpectinata]CAG2100978.1 unnamed protein product [Medioppia subpectinata]
MDGTFDNLLNTKMVMGRPMDRYGMIRPPVVSKIGDQFEEHWFEQRVDHFNKHDNKTFKQLYYVGDNYYKTGGPVFLLISGECEAGTFWLTNATYMGQMAKKYGALAVVLEHRYYGRSVPTPDLSTQNLKHLSIELALKDTEQFALYLTKRLSLEGSKWVVFGGSYAGALAAWFREKYPNIAVGAIASSAPVETTVNNMNFLKVVSESLGKECSNNIRKANMDIENLLKTPEGVIKLRKTLNLCDTFDGKNINDNRWLAQEMMNNIALTVQYNTNISHIIETMNDPSGGTPLERYAKLQTWDYFNQTNACNDVKYADYIAKVKNITINPKIVERQWLYQTCTELGYFETTDLPDCAFGHNIPVEYYIQQCVDIFGPQITAQTVRNGIHRTNAYYGGLKPNVTNVVFPNGSLDPWHALSVLTDINNTTKAVMIENYSHGGDMYASSPSDTQSLKNAHKLIEQQIGEYLK